MKISNVRENTQEFIKTIELSWNRELTNYATEKIIIVTLDPKNCSI